MLASENIIWLLLTTEHFKASCLRSSGSSKKKKNNNNVQIFNNQTVTTLLHFAVLYISPLVPLEQWKEKWNKAKVFFSPPVIWFPTLKHQQKLFHYLHRSLQCSGHWSAGRDGYIIAPYQGWTTSQALGWLIPVYTFPMFKGTQG